MPRPIHEVYRYRLWVAGDPKLVDLIMFDDETKKLLMVVLTRIPRDIGLKLVVELNDPRPAALQPIRDGAPQPGAL